MKNISVLGIDLAKNVFQLHGINDKGTTILRKKITRSKLPVFISNLPPCLIGMEACSGANYWGRKFESMGHEVKLIPPQYVKPYVKTNKNDAADAEAISEAVQRPNMRFVPIKRVQQQDIQNMHRVRSRLVRTRTAISNEIRGILHEYGIVIARGHKFIRENLKETIEIHQDKLTPASRELFENLWEEFISLDERISKFNIKIEAHCRSNPVCKKIEKIPGIGTISATILAASINPQSFKNGRGVSAWLGLVPRQYSSGGKDKLLGMSKRGDPYIRTLMIHGARAVIRHLGEKEDRQSRWLKDLVERRGKNRAAVALANKNARVVWALMTKEEPYRMAV